MRYNIYDNNLQYLENFILDITNSNYIEIGLRLLQWQYWWWFWMAFNWGILTAVLNRIFRSKNSFFSTKIYTSIRPHAKFGDFISTIIPLFWVTNILINSNYILRILEWQNDITLFTVRIIGRQWYWVYKYELKNILDYYTLPKQIGLNKWISFNFNSNIISLDYYYTFFLKNNNYININNYWNNFFDNSKKEFFLNKYINTLNLNILNNNILNNNILNNNILNNNILNNNILNNNSLYERDLKQKNINFFYSRILLDKNNFFFKINKNNFSKNYIYKDILDVLSISIKQKRYTQNRYYTNSNNLIKDNNLNYINKQVNPYLLKNNIQTLNFLDYLIEYKFINKLKKNEDNNLLSSYISRRILRVRKSLVLPINLNINLITSSYDVVHSWFVPGLCIKIDCVPGKATHHTLNIDSQGFYYGQCAEICGRYHHHMPIRICALSFEHFLIWWNHFGLYRLYKPLNIQNLNRFNNIFIW